MKYLYRTFPSMNERLKILFVCTVNRMRSATAQKIFEADERFEIRSAGTDESATVVLNNTLLKWADVIIAMDNEHIHFIKNHFGNICINKKIACLHIPDEYNFMQPELIALIRQRFEDILSRGLLNKEI